MKRTRMKNNVRMKNVKCPKCSKIHNWGCGSNCLTMTLNCQCGTNYNIFKEITTKFKVINRLKYYRDDYIYKYYQINDICPICGGKPKYETKLDGRTCVECGKFLFADQDEIWFSYNDDRYCITLQIQANSDGFTWYIMKLENFEIYRTLLYNYEDVFTNQHKLHTLQCKVANKVIQLVKCGKVKMVYGGSVIIGDDKFPVAVLNAIRIDTQLYGQDDSCIYDDFLGYSDQYFNYMVRCEQEKWSDQEDLDQQEKWSDCVDGDDTLGDCDELT